LGASRTRSGLLAGAGALLAYDYLALGLPGSMSIVTGMGGFGGLLASVVGGVLTLGAVWAWRRYGSWNLAERG
jgi:hypothetical protein